MALVPVLFLRRFFNIQLLIYDLETSLYLFGWKEISDGIYRYISHFVFNRTR